MNDFTLDVTVSVIDRLYRGRDYQRFWVLEEIARAPYFAFLSVLHLRESMGLRGPDHIDLMLQHFEQSINETSHLEYMEKMGGNNFWIDRFFAKHLVIIYYWINVFYYLFFPKSAYDLAMKIEVHAAVTYATFLAINGPDEKILEILNDELEHVHELTQAMEKIK